MTYRGVQVTGMSSLCYGAIPITKIIHYSGVYRWCSFFFFQAEDGIRDLTVTGVQTCALPISRSRALRSTNNRRYPTSNHLTARGGADYKLELTWPRLTWPEHDHPRLKPKPAPPDRKSVV